MKLHNNKEAFNNLISIISDYYKIDAALIEKDYETLTRIMMYKYVDYEEAIESLKTIIQSKIFEVNK